MKKPASYLVKNVIVSAAITVILLMAFSLIMGSQADPQIARFGTVVLLFGVPWVVFAIAGRKWDREHSEAVEKTPNTQGASVQSIAASPRLKRCRACDAQISKTSNKCPHCGEINMGGGRVFAGVLVAAGCAWFFYGFHGVEKKVANDLEEGYALAKKGGDKMEICVRAGAAAAGYNQAKDEENYLKWKRIQRFDCELAGIKTP